MSAGTVVRFPSRTELNLKIRIAKARELADTDSEFARLFRYWFNKWNGQADGDKAAWMQQHPCPITLAEAEEFDRIMREHVLQASERAKQALASRRQKEDREFEAFLQPRPRTRRHSREA